MPNPSKNEATQWSLILVFAMAIWATQYPFVKILTTNVDPFLLSSLRFLFASLVALPIFLISKKVKTPTKKELFTLISLGLILAINSSLAFIGITLSNPILASIILNTNPLWIAVIAPFLIAEKFTLKKAAIIITGIIGIVISTTNGQPINELFLSKSHYGIISLLSASVLIAIYSIASKKMVQLHGAFLTNLLIMSFASLWLIPVTFANNSIYQLTTFDLQTWIIIFLLGAVSTAIPYTLWKNSLNHIPTTTAGAFKLLIPIFTTIYAITFLNESLTIYISSGIILTTIALYQIQKTPSIKKAQPSGPPTN